MKARIEKKLSKRLARLHPSLYRRVWADRDFSELAYEQRTRVSHCLSVGGLHLTPTDSNDAYGSFGATHLIAACRAIVAIKIGDTVQVPAELAKPLNPA